MSKKLFLSIAVCTAFAFAGASATFAGEVNGKGEPTPISDKANSDCAFSGLEDFDTGGELVEPGVVQSFGKHPNGAFGTGVSDDPANRPSGPGRAAPGFACNPSDPS